MRIGLRSQCLRASILVVWLLYISTCTLAKASTHHVGLAEQEAHSHRALRSYRQNQPGSRSLLQSSSSSGYAVTYWGSLGSNPTITTVENIADVAAGFAHLLLLDTQGKVQASGNANPDQPNLLNVPATAQAANSTKAVAAGEWHSLALLQTGQVIAWGDNSSGQLDIPAAAQSGVVSISTKGNWSMAVLSAAPWVVAWGQNNANQTVIPAAAQSQNIKSVSAGAWHGLALLNDGTVISWGNNQVNQSTIPAEIQGNVTEISAGGFFSLFLLNNGTVVSVGDNSQGQQNVPPMARSHVKSVRAGWAFAIALLDNGQVVHWGEDDVGNKNQGLLPAQALSGVVAIEAGYDSGFAFRPQDTSTVLGYDLYAYGGDVQRGVLRNVISVAAGFDHGLAIMTDGMIQAWGYTPVTSPDTAVPTQAIDGATALMVAAGYQHSLALLENRTVIAWGGGYDTSSAVPAQLQTNTPTSAVAIAAGDAHSMALMSDGSVVAWLPDSGILPLPPAITQGSVRAISVTKDQNAVQLANGTLVAWTVNANGAPVGAPVTRSGVAAASAGIDHVLVLYVNGTVEDIATGTTNYTVPGSAQSGVSAVSAGEQSLVLKYDGTVVTWMPPNSNADHNQADISTKPSPAVAHQFVGIASGWYTAMGLVPSQPLPAEPAPVPAPPSPPPRPLNGFGANVSAWGAGITQNGANYLTNVVMVAAGANHGLALLTDGNITSWGANDQGQRNVPPAIIGKVTSLACGSNFSVALLNDGSVTAWGQNDLFRTSVPADLSSGGGWKATAIAAGGTFGVALLTTGGVTGWGTTGYGATTLIPDAALSGVTAISAGDAHVLALKGDQVIAWGADLEGEATVPFEATTNVQAIAAGSYHSLALLNNGTVIAWGANFQGQSIVPPSAKSNVVAIAAGELHSLALLADGTVVQWGDSSRGQGIPPAVLSGVTRIAAGGDTSYALQDPPLPPGSGGGSGGGTASPASTNSKSTPVGAIAGGVVGGVVALLALTVMGFCLVRRNRHSRSPSGLLGMEMQQGYPTHRHESDSDDAAAVVSVPDQFTGVVTATKSSWQGHSGISGLSGPSGMPNHFPMTPASAAGTPIAPGYSIPNPALAASIHWNTIAPGSIYSPSMQSAQHTRASGMPPTPTHYSGGGLTIPESYASEDVTIIMQERMLDSMRIIFSDIAIGGVLGEGGFGKVYKGTWRGNRVAVKMLNLDGVRPEAKQMLHQEALIMCQLHHPSIARVFGVVDEGRHQALVMQYYKRGTLARFMTSLSYQNLTGAERLKFAVQVAGGMCFLHERRPLPVLHGDLKASNLLLEDEGQRVVIADFGLACRLHSPSAGMQMGALTASISPPEVLLSPTAPRSVAADVYGFGIVLLEIMLGRPAFPGMRAQQIKQIVISGGRPNIPEEVPAPIQAIIASCWAQEPSARPTFPQLLPYLEAAAASLLSIEGNGVTEMPAERTEDTTNW